MHPSHRHHWETSNSQCLQCGTGEDSNIPEGLGKARPWGTLGELLFSNDVQSKPSLKQSDAHPETATDIQKSTWSKGEICGVLCRWGRNHAVWNDSDKLKDADSNCDKMVFWHLRRSLEKKLLLPLVGEILSGERHCLITPGAPHCTGQRKRQKVTWVLTSGILQERESLAPSVGILPTMHLLPKHLPDSSVTWLLFFHCWTWSNT